jgi:hypothetical protein
MQGNYNADKEAAIYCARECARIGNRKSTWTYRDLWGGLYEITAKPDGDKIRITTRKG